MGVFVYKAFSETGQMTEGRVDAPGRREALRLLEERGLRPVRVEDAAGRPAESETGGWDPLAMLRGRVTARDREQFTRQLASLLAAGVSLSRALQILSRESSRPLIAARWKRLREMVVDGMSLADAMARQPDVFPRIDTAMVRAGETGGFLPLVLGQVADFQSRDREVRSRLVSAMTYPAVLMALTVAVVIFLMTFFIPRFQTMFEGLGAPLPLLTRAIIAASEGVRDWGLVVAAVLVIALVAARQWIASPAGRRSWQTFALRMPLFGSLAARFAATRFCRMLGTLSRSGVELITALQVSRESLGNQVLIDTLTSSIENVRKGESLARSLAACERLFPPSTIEMIAVAEESSRLDQELVRIAEESEKDLDGQLRLAVALAEPALLFVMAAVIGTIFIGMVLPIFTIQDYIK
ncbi:MAG: ral secretion pathway protein [Candidatus Sumerlaeota bacterium]|nr:ral secretion pathway protein [Candidatus Sumerlaeota bacterium]